MSTVRLLGTQLLLLVRVEWAWATWLSEVEIACGRLQGAVQRADGALAVGLVSAVRSAAVAAAAAALFCRRAARPAVQLTLSGFGRAA